MARIDDLLALQAIELDRLTDAQARSVLQAYVDGQRELRARLAGLDPRLEETGQRLRVTLAQAEEGVVALKQRLGIAIEAGELAAHQTAMRHLKDQIGLMEPKLLDAGPAVDTALLARLAEQRGLLLHRHSLDRYGADLADAMQRQITSGVLQGQSLDELADAIAGEARSVMALKRHRAELIARMELNRAYNDGHLASARELEAMDPRPEDPLMKRIDEYFDNRNHPFSRAANGRMAKLDEPFRVPVAQVAAFASLGKKGTGGVTWLQEGGQYVGMNLPAHFNERGRIVTWRASWGAPPEPEPPPPPAPEPDPIGPGPLFPPWQPPPPVQPVGPLFPPWTPVPTPTIGPIPLRPPVIIPDLPKPIAPGIPLRPVRIPIPQFTIGPGPLFPPWTPVPAPTIGPGPLRPPDIIPPRPTPPPPPRPGPSPPPAWISYPGPWFRYPGPYIEVPWPVVTPPPRVWLARPDVRAPRDFGLTEPPRIVAPRPDIRSPRDLGVSPMPELDAYAESVRLTRLWIDESDDPRAVRIREWEAETRARQAADQAAMAREAESWGEVEQVFGALRVVSSPSVMDEFALLGELALEVAPLPERIKALNFLAEVSGVPRPYPGNPARFPAGAVRVRGGVGNADDAEFLRRAGPVLDALDNAGYRNLPLRSYAAFSERMARVRMQINALAETNEWSVLEVAAQARDLLPLRRRQPPGTPAEQAARAVWKGDRFDAKAFRDWAVDLLEAEGLSAVEWRADLTPVRSGVEAVGYWSIKAPLTYRSGDGLLVTPRAHELLTRWAKAGRPLAKDSVARQTAVRDVVREVVRGASPMSSEATQGLGHVIQQVTDEALTASLMASRFGVTGSVGLYRAETDWMLGAIRKVAPDADAVKILESAARMFKGRLGRLNTVDEAVEAFVQDVAATAGWKPKLRNRFRQLLADDARATPLPEAPPPPMNAVQRGEVHLEPPPKEIPDLGMDVPDRWRVVKDRGDEVTVPAVLDWAVVPDSLPVGRTARLLLEAPDGRRWLVRDWSPLVPRSETMGTRPAPVATTQAVREANRVRLQRALGLETPDITEWTLNARDPISTALNSHPQGRVLLRPRTVTLQEYVQPVRDLSRASLRDLTPEQRRDLWKNMLFDWLIGNRDATGADLLIARSGKLVAVDKGGTTTYEPGERLTWRDAKARQALTQPENGRVWRMLDEWVDGGLPDEMLQGPAEDPELRRWIESVVARDRDELSRASGLLLEGPIEQRRQTLLADAERLFDEIRAARVAPRPLPELPPVEDMGRWVPRAEPPPVPPRPPPPPPVRAPGVRRASEPGPLEEMEVLAAPTRAIGDPRKVVVRSPSGDAEEVWFVRHTGDAQLRRELSAERLREVIGVDGLPLRKVYAGSGTPLGKAFRGSVDLLATPYVGPDDVARDLTRVRLVDLTPEQRRALWKQVVLDYLVANPQSTGAELLILQDGRLVAPTRSGAFTGDVRLEFVPFDERKGARHTWRAMQMLDEWVEGVGPADLLDDPELMDWARRISQLTKEDLVPTGTSLMTVDTLPLMQRLRTLPERLEQLFARARQARQAP